MPHFHSLSVLSVKLMLLHHNFQSFTIFHTFFSSFYGNSYHTYIYFKLKNKTNQMEEHDSELSELSSNWEQSLLQEQVENILGKSRYIQGKCNHWLRNGRSRRSGRSGNLNNNLSKILNSHLNNSCWSKKYLNQSRYSTTKELVNDFEQKINL